MKLVRENYALSIKHYAFTMNSSLSDRRERSLLTPHYTSYLLPPTSYLNAYCLFPFFPFSTPRIWRRSSSDRSPASTR